MSEVLRKVPAALRFTINEGIVLFIIFLNAAIFLILDINPDISFSYPWLEYVDIVCILYFIFEALLKVYILGAKNYFEDNWNKFDSVIVISSMPILLEPFVPFFASNLAWTPILRMTRVLRLARFLRLGRLIKYARRDGALEEFRAPIYFILFIVTLNFFFSLVNLPDHIDNFISIIYSPLLILSSVAIISKISLIIQNIYIAPLIENEYEESSEAILNFGRTAYVIILWSIGLIVSIEVAGFNSFSLIAGLGIGSVAVAFAAQDALGNIIAGISLFAQKHFKIGEYLKIGENEGKVINLGLRSFILECRDGSRISIPNKTINSLAVQNLSIRKHLRDNIYLQLSSSLSSDELKSSLDIIKNTCIDFNLISKHRIKAVEMKFTHNITISFISNIDEAKKELGDICEHDMLPKIATRLYIKIFENLEKSELTPENKILFMQNA